MRWIWIDRILELETARRCVAVKNVSLAEDVLHDHFPACASLPPQPIMPNTLIIEGMAQTAGILVGKTGSFAHNVVLAKISRATFTAAALPGDRLVFTATLERFDEAGAATTGTIDVQHAGSSQLQTLGRVDLLFSHVNGKNSAGLPSENFVFSGPLLQLLKLAGAATAM